MASGLRLLLVGATGAVGGAVLEQALARRDIGRIIAPTRRPLARRAAKLDNPVLDMAALTGDEDFWACDAVICTLGTTIRAAGSQAAFARVDRDLPILIGRFAKAGGATRYALNSSLGASPTGNFYLRTKAEAEQGIIDQGFASTTIVRPSLIDAEREQSRPAEHLGVLLARALKPLIPKKFRAVTPQQIAQALLRGVLAGEPGVHVVESDAL
jgi:uncharacterized protein YbjT (DUF2867 family)